jgi:ankyrin repeat protein
LKSCSSQNISAIRYYLRQGVNINILDQERTSPLHIAARFASPSVVEELLNSGSNIDITDSVKAKKKKKKPDKLINEKKLFLFYKVL